MHPSRSSVTPSPNLEVSALEDRALKIREHIVRLSTGGGCFIGASLSAVEIILTLYERFLNIPSPDSPERDYFFLSKGHDVPALYGTFVELGLMEQERLSNHLSPEDRIYWHPNRSIPFVEFHSGSLGHLLSVAVGVALDCKRSGSKNRVVVVLGDGELNEGSNWEALLVAKAYGLNNLLLVVDRNEFQANVETEKLIPLEPLDKKFEAFGAGVETVDGHDFRSLDSALRRFPYSQEGPSTLIARTVRGKGLPSIERRADRWFCNFSPDEVQDLLEELHGRTKATIKSETMTVR